MEHTELTYDMHFRLQIVGNRPLNVIEKVMEDPEYNLEEWNPFPPFRQDLIDRQDVDIGNPLVVALAGGFAILAFQLLLPLLAPLLSLSGSNPYSLERLSVPLLPPVSMLGLPALAVTREERPRLQNHPRCGITTGGQVRFVCPIILYLSLQHNLSRRNVGGIVRSSLERR